MIVSEFGVAKGISVYDDETPEGGWKVRDIKIASAITEHRKSFG